MAHGAELSNTGGQARGPMLRDKGLTGPGGEEVVHAFVVDLAECNARPVLHLTGGRGHEGGHAQHACDMVDV